MVVGPQRMWARPSTRTRMSRAWRPMATLGRGRQRSASDAPVGERATCPFACAAAEAATFAWDARRRRTRRAEARRLPTDSMPQARRSDGRQVGPVRRHPPDEGRCAVGCIGVELPAPARRHRGRLRRSSPARRSGHRADRTGPWSSSQSGLPAVIAWATSGQRTLASRYGTARSASTRYPVLARIRTGRHGRAERSAAAPGARSRKEHVLPSRAHAGPLPRADNSNSR